MSETSSPSLSFDRMRTMLMRAAEIRDSEQQQVFDSLDEIHARLATLDTLGSMRKRLSEVPDRTELRQLAQRLDEAVAKMDAQDSVLAAIGRAVEAVTESLIAKLSTPLAQLDGRLDGVAGRFEGVAGRMDGLEDRLSGVHKRLDDLDHRLDRHELRIDALPNAVGGPLRERFDGLDAAVTALQPAIGASRDTLDGRIDAVATRLDEVAARIGAVEDGIGGRIGDLAGALEQGLGRLDGLLARRPDNDSVARLTRQANQDSERRMGAQLDEAMATFAELILGRGGTPNPPVPAPRPATRRTRNKVGAAPDSEQNSDPSPPE